MNNYTDINSKIVDKWVSEGWEWGQMIDHETFIKAKQGNWSVVLTPTKAVPKYWFLYKLPINSFHLKFYHINIITFLFYKFFMSTHF